MRDPIKLPEETTPFLTRRSTRSGFEPHVTVQQWRATKRGRYGVISDFTLWCSIELSLRRLSDSKIGDNVLKLFNPTFWDQA